MGRFAPACRGLGALSEVALRGGGRQKCHKLIDGDGRAYADDTSSLLSPR